MIRMEKRLASGNIQEMGYDLQRSLGAFGREYAPTRDGVGLVSRLDCF